MQRFIRFVATFINKISLAVLRAIILGVVFTGFGMLMLYYSGLPVPGLSDLLDKFDGLGRLAGILSR